ncbi:MAG TPA: zf-HC2 domain-containing protein [Thermoanaerobaculia bacterium]|nr:zf-HC2 domain-containing protein [Thermoanaerobaculia bacterium]
MSCDFFERHWTAGDVPGVFEAHRAECGECAALSGDLVRLAAMESRIGLPDLPPALVDRWRAIPALTVDCDTASELSALALEGPLSERDRARREGHLARCAECRETAEVLGTLPVLRPADPTARPRMPRPAGRVVAFAPRRPRTAGWTDPRLYAAAACLLAGFFALFANTLELGTTASGLGRQVRVRWTEASDRFRMWEEGASRTLVATRESLTGYTKAVGAIALSAAGRATEGLFRNEPKTTEKGNKS